MSDFVCEIPSANRNVWGEKGREVCGAAQILVLEWEKWPVEEAAVQGL